MNEGGVVFIGSPTDARGFRLVGVTAVPPTRDAITRAVGGWLSPDARRPALVIVSPDAFALASDQWSALETDPDGSIVLILPDDEEISFDGVPGRSGRTSIERGRAGPHEG